MKYFTIIESAAFILKASYSTFICLTCWKSRFRNKLNALKLGHGPPFAHGVLWLAKKYQAQKNAQINWNWPVQLTDVTHRMDWLPGKDLSWSSKSGFLTSRPNHRVTSAINMRSTYHSVKKAKIVATYSLIVATHNLNLKPRNLP